MTTAQQKLQAFESAKKFGELFPGLLETLQEWASIGSIEQAAEEAGRRLAAARAEEAQFKLDRDAAFDQAGERLRLQSDQAQAQSALARDVAKRELATTVAERERMVGMATDQVERAQARVEALKAEHQEWLDKTEAAKADHAGLAEKVAAAHSEHQTVLAVIADAKARLG